MSSFWNGFEKRAISLLNRYRDIRETSPEEASRFLDKNQPAILRNYAMEIDGELTHFSEPKQSPLKKSLQGAASIGVLGAASGALTTPRAKGALLLEIGRAHV